MFESSLHGTGLKGSEVWSFGYGIKTRSKYNSHICRELNSSLLAKKCSNMMKSRFYLLMHSFFTVFTKGDNFCDFLFASLDDTTLPKWGPL